MKKLLWLTQIIVAITLLVLPACLGGCSVTSTTTETVTSTTTDHATSTVTETITSAVPRCASSTMPSDFYIIYETSLFSSSSFGALLNTKNNTMGAVGFDYTVNFHISWEIPCEDLQAIYDAIIAHDIASLSGPDIIVNPTMVVAPRAYYRLRFRLDGVIYSVSYDNAIVLQGANTLYSDLRSLHTMLDNYYRNTDEYKSLPPPPALT